MTCCKDKTGLSTAKKRADEYFLTFGVRVAVIEESKGSFAIKKYDEIQGGVNIWYDTGAPE